MQKPTRLARTAAVVLVAALAATGCARPVATPAQHVAAEPVGEIADVGQVPSQALVEPTDPDNPRVGPDEPKIGKTYPYDLYTHCGIEYAEFGGRTWLAAEALPDPDPVADAEGVSIYSGYIAGTMTLMDEKTAHFLADLRYASLSDPLVIFHPTKKQAPLCK